MQQNKLTLTKTYIIKIRIQNSTFNHSLPFDDEIEFKNFPSLLLKNSIIEFIVVDDNDYLPEAEWN